MKQFKLKVHPGSSQEKIKFFEDKTDFIEVWLKVKAIDNKANLRLIKVLKKHFKKPIRIKRGLTSRNKIIEVN